MADARLPDALAERLRDVIDGTVVVNSAGYDVPESVVAEAIRVLALAKDAGALPHAVVGDEGERGLAIYYMSREQLNGGARRYAGLSIRANGEFAVWKRDNGKPAGIGYFGSWVLIDIGVIADMSSFARLGVSLIGPP